MSKAIFVSAAIAAAAFALPKGASACTPVGLIHDKWQQLYSDLGPCINNAISDRAGGQYEQFDYGYVDWINGYTQAYAVYGYIGAAWVSRYGGAAATGQRSLTTILRPGVHEFTEPRELMSPLRAAC